MRLLRFLFLRSLLAFSLVVALSLSPSMITPEGSARGALRQDDSGPKELEAFQGYLDPAPDGMDVRYAWTLPGGRGENVRIVDIEFNWNLNHNDLTPALSDAFLIVRGRDDLPEMNVNHGTAVLGQLIAAPDDIGVTGIAHRAKIGLINPVNDGTTPRVADAINRALQHLEPGDVILLEQQSALGPRFNVTNGRGLLPIEFEPEVFTAIKSATQRGIIVIEPAGNGFENLDDPIYDGAFNRTKRDSGAIVVGAGLPPQGIYGGGPDRVRVEESNYGSRVDLQGWGRFVTTCGYGDLRREQGENNWYTTLFGGTSSASAMVAGAAAVLQSIVKERGLPPLTPARMRQLLASTGTLQTGNRNQNIGPRPNLRAAIEALDSDDPTLPPIITRLSYKQGKGQLVVDGENFIPRDSIIEIDGVGVAKHKYPAGSILPNGRTTRILAKKNVSSMIPPGSDVIVTVLTRSTGERSEAVTFRRN
ncbi:MAG TPA: S8 family serine peptidase [Blastocatellia bacterium]|nr:S8 family serine peptidase [Blastocatellia bacterium]